MHFDDSGLNGGKIKEGCMNPPGSMTTSTAMTGLEEFVRDQYALLAADREMFLVNVTEDVEWTVLGPAELTKCGSYTGREGVRDFFNKLDANWQFSSPLELVEIFEAPHLGVVVAITREHGTNKKSGQRFVARGTHLWKIEGPSIVGPDQRCGLRVKGFQEFLVVWDGEDEISMVPEMKSLILSVPSSSVDDDAKKKGEGGLQIDAGAFDKNVSNANSVHFGIHGGDLA